MKRLQGFKNSSILYTGAGFEKSLGRRPQDSEMGAITNGAIVYETTSTRPHGEIVWVGSSDAIPAAYQSAHFQDLNGKQAIIPGLIDSHTHLVFGGNRAGEFAERCGGVSYEEIAKRGGGIRHTVRSTRALSEDALFEIANARLDQRRKLGIRGIETKSGYGLSLDSELRILRVNRRLAEQNPDFRFHSTFLGAHDFPDDLPREDYLKLIVNEMIPEVAKQKLADSCDVFIDRGFYTLDEGRLILETAIKHGLPVRVHADELVNTESAKLAADLGALSADHLLKISDTGIQALAHSDTIATILPGTAFYLKTAQAPARKLIDAGARVAIATDFNPGTSVTHHLPFMLTISALYQGMTRAELFAAVTYNAACALGWEKTAGTLTPGKDALITVLPFGSFEETYYEMSWIP